MDDDSSAGNSSRRQPSAVSSLKAVSLACGQWSSDNGTDRPLRSVKSVGLARSVAIETAPVLIAELPI